MYVCVCVYVSKGEKERERKNVVERFKKSGSRTASFADVKPSPPLSPFLFVSSPVIGQTFFFNSAFYKQVWRSENYSDPFSFLLSLIAFSAPLALLFFFLSVRWSHNDRQFR